MQNRHRGFAQLIDESRGQRLFSGLTLLVWQLAQRICAKLGIKLEDFFEYILNNGGVWTDERLLAGEELEEDEDEATRSLDEYVADLDVAILSLIDDLDAPAEQLADELDEILKNSLWRRTLVRLENDALQKMEREVIVSRSRWLWANTTNNELTGLLLLRG